MAHSDGDREYSPRLIADSITSFGDQQQAIYPLAVIRLRCCWNNVAVVDTRDVCDFREIRKRSASFLRCSCYLEADNWKQVFPPVALRGVSENAFGMI